MNARTVLKDERLKEILSNREHEAPTINALVNQWWGLTQVENDAIERMHKAEAELASMRERGIKCMGGKETLERMLLELVCSEPTPVTEPADLADYERQKSRLRSVVGTAKAEASVSRGKAEKKAEEVAQAAKGNAPPSTKDAQGSLRRRGKNKDQRS